jgi:hypothetical protein
MSTRRGSSTQVAKSVPFKNDTAQIDGDPKNVQTAIENLANDVSTSASPGFSFGRASNVNNGTWLLCETVPSNKSGRFVYITNAIVEKVFVSSEDIATYDLEIWYHDGNSINLTLLDTVSVTASRGGAFTVGQSVPTNKQLAIRLVNGSAKNVVAGLELSGTN